MVHQISYNTISHAVDSWEQLRRIKNYEQIAGAKLFQLYVLLLVAFDSSRCSILSAAQQQHSNRARTHT